ncbi:hypothetical protein [uncultured Enterovirga sp.]|uniref:hypothetical protein n=1 Tax=uncultured Enterovirga sp. TaxID=2026352 RepID=UPI0035CB342C
MRQVIRGAIGLVALLAAAAASAQTRPTVTSLKEAPKTFLFVGNSFYYYNNSMHSYFLDVARKADPANAKAYRGTSVTISGSGLNWHDMEGYFGKGMASYSFDEANNVVFNDFAKPFDVVVMNDCSQCPVHPQLSGLFRDFVKKHGDTIRARNAEPVLFMTWAYEDKPEMTAQLAQAYTEEANRNGMLVIPAGLAFAEAIARRRDIALYQPDKRHPTLAGTYLAAVTTYAALFGKSPVGNASAGMPSIGILDPATAAFLQQVARDTVQRYTGG